MLPNRPVFTEQSGPGQTPGQGDVELAEDDAGRSQSFIVSQRGDESQEHDHPVLGTEELDSRIAGSLLQFVSPADALGMQNGTSASLGAAQAIDTLKDTPPAVVLGSEPMSAAGLSQRRSSPEANLRARASREPTSPPLLIPPPPDALRPPPRRPSERPGNLVTAVRLASPRHLQLVEVLRGHPKPWEAIPPVPTTDWSTPQRAAPAKRSLFDSPPNVPQKSNFKLNFASGTEMRPRHTHHVLLAAIEAMQDDDHVTRHRDMEQAVLSQRLDELRWREKRRGPWTARPQSNSLKATANAAEEKKSIHPPQGNVGASPRVHTHSPARSGDRTVEVEQIIKLLDPTASGSIPPDSFVPLMFWLGLTRRRGAALATLELAFGTGPIAVASIRRLAAYAEVQLRLVDGFKRLARRESVEQPCEFITSWTRLREWFYSMKRDTTSRVEIVEVQNLFARMEVTTDRAILFRYINSFARDFAAPPTPVGPAAAVMQAVDLVTPRFRQRTLGVQEFASMLCRCVMTWCLLRAMAIVNAPEPSGIGFGGNAATESINEQIMWSKAEAGALSPLGRDRETTLRWTQLQRRIVVSLLVNHRFWGRESRNVLAMQRPQPGREKDLSQEEWNLLFQRVRAQGIASTLTHAGLFEEEDKENGEKTLPQV
mmetsp:Transcript_8519/g.15208  ORF Transcript_8519/g.15208 Transcript_8519/m.15208 type:complete len:655 (+) Transcript_8519:67-2031(+)